MDRLRRGKHLRSGLTTGAVCVYPLRVADCRKSFHKLNSTLPIASVVAGFPAGQGPRGSTLGEISFAIESGATEIDIVINRTHALTGQWQTLYEEIKCIADHCHKCGAHLKVILAYGELASLDNVYKVSEHVKPGIIHALTLGIYFLHKFNTNRIICMEKIRRRCVP